jgi:hypothetical protein
VYLNSLSVFQIQKFKNLISFSGATFVFATSMDMLHVLSRWLRGSERRYDGSTVQY